METFVMDKGGGNLVGPGLVTAVGVIASVPSAFSHLHIPSSPLPQPVHASSHTVSLGLARFTARIRVYPCSGIPSSRTMTIEAAGLLVVADLSAEDLMGTASYFDILILAPGMHQQQSIDAGENADNRCDD